MGEFRLTGNIILPSSIDIDQASFQVSVDTSTVRCDVVVCGSLARIGSAGNIEAGNCSFGTVNFAVATTAFSSNNAVAGLSSNHLYFTVEGTVARIYFNQTGTAVFRATINLATF